MHGCEWRVTQSECVKEAKLVFSTVKYIMGVVDGPENETTAQLLADSSTVKY